MARHRSAGADHGAEHELEDGFFAERVGDDLQAPAFLDEEALQQVRLRVARRCAIGTLRWAMQASKSSMKQGGRTGQLGLEVVDHALGQVARDGA